MSRVFTQIISRPYTFFRCEPSPFMPCITNDERDKVAQYAVNNAKHLFNGTTIRLNGIADNDDKLLLSISKATYFDSIASNMVYHKYHDKLNTLDNSCKVENDIIKVVANINNAGIDGFEAVLSNHFLANTIAVSVLVRDTSNMYCLVFRANTLAVGAGLLSVTVTGALDESDYDTDDPVISCAARELLEELGIVASSFTVDSIAISKTKLQPIFIVNAEVTNTWENVISTFDSAKDYSKEIANYVIASVTDLKKIMNENQMTDAARYHLESILSRFE